MRRRVPILRFARTQRVVHRRRFFERTADIVATERPMRNVQRTIKLACGARISRKRRTTRSIYMAAVAAVTTAGKNTRGRLYDAGTGERATYYRALRRDAIAIHDAASSCRYLHLHLR